MLTFFFIFAKQINCHTIMKKISLNQHVLFAILLIIAAAFLRIFIPFDNVTPVAAIALFAGTYIKRREFAILLPLVILLISDVFLGFYSPILMLGVYGSFVAIACIGFLLRRRTNILTIIGSSVLSSVLFFIITNLVVWAEGIWYPLTLSGLSQCYILALPFFRPELLGTLAFNLFFFGSYALITQRIPAFRSVE